MLYAVYLLYPSSIRCGIRPSLSPLTTTHGQRPTLSCSISALPFFNSLWHTPLCHTAYDHACATDDCNNLGTCNSCLLAGKTPACGTVKPGEPQLCARVGAGNAHGAVDPDGTGEPFNYHIINRYFDEYLLRAVTLANVRKRVGK